MQLIWRDYATSKDQSGYEQLGVVVINSYKMKEAFCFNSTDEKTDISGIMCSLIFWS